MTTPAELAEHFAPTPDGEDKRLPLAEAVRRFVEPGMHLHLAYCGARPNAAVAEVVRAFHGTSPGFTVSAHGLVNSQLALLADGLVSRLIAAYVGENYPAPAPNPVFQRALAEGGVELENWSLWTLTARLMAAGLGLPGMPVRSLVGSGMADEHRGERFTETAPFGDGPSSGVVAPLRPDVVLLQGAAADPNGNVVMPAPYGEGAWGALAANVGVIACVEHVVSVEELRAQNAAVRIPAHLVRAVCHTPFGSHPYGLYDAVAADRRRYAEDVAFVRQVRDASRQPEAFTDWMDEWVLKPGDHEGYLQQLGEGRLTSLVGRGRGDSWQFEGPSLRTAADPATTEERMVLATSRLLGERIRRDGHDAVLAGIGLAHLAAWMAVRAANRDGVDVRLLTELGMLGYDPRPGDPYLFANRNLPTCRQLTDVTDVLGAYVSGPATRCLGVLGAGQIDGNGDINSTWTADGTFLTGSGGANDVASGADDVVVTIRHSPRRLVDVVPYITAPGVNVSAIVTSQAVLERRDGKFVLTGLLEPLGDDREAALAAITDGIGFDVEVAPDPVTQPAPDPDELAVLRSFDRDGVFLGV